MIYATSHQIGYLLGIIEYFNYSQKYTEEQLATMSFGDIEKLIKTVWDHHMENLNSNTKE